MDKVNFNPLSEILVEDFLRQSGYIGDAFKMFIADFLCQNTAVLGLEVTVQSVPDMSIYTKPGRIYQSGLQGQLITNLDPALTITAAHPQYDRIDRICAQYHEMPDTPETRNVMIDTVSRQVTQKSVMTRIAGSINFMVVAGVAAPGPAAPTVPDGWTSLAQIKVRADTTSILQTDIMDERPTLKSLMTHAHSGGIDGAKVDYNSLLNRPDLSGAETVTGAQQKADAAKTAAEQYADKVIVFDSKEPVAYNNNTVWLRNCGDAPNFSVGDEVVIGNATTSSSPPTSSYWFEEQN